MNKDPMEQNQGNPPGQPMETSSETHKYTYEPAGIQERSGFIPTWLIIVALSLIIWGIYYMIRFWSSN